jgi:outer membrane lipoprotein SlyB
MNKLARIFGARAPDVSEAAVPYGQRKKEYARYVKRKAGEKPTPMGKASLVGGLVGGALGALTTGGGSSAVVGGVLGGLGGALIGAGLSAQDESHIRAAKSIVRSGNFDQATVAAVKRQLADKQHRREMDEYYKERRAEDRHRDLRTRLDRIDRRTRY